MVRAWVECVLLMVRPIKLPLLLLELLCLKLARCARPAPCRSRACRWSRATHPASTTLWTWQVCAGVSCCVQSGATHLGLHTSGWGRLPSVAASCLYS